MHPLCITYLNIKKMCSASILSKIIKKKKEEGPISLFDEIKWPNIKG